MCIGKFQSVPPPTPFERVPHSHPLLRYTTVLLLAAHIAWALGACSLSLNCYQLGAETLMVICSVHLCYLCLKQRWQVSVMWPTAFSVFSRSRSERSFFFFFFCTCEMVWERRECFDWNPKQRSLVHNTNPTGAFLPYTRNYSVFQSCDGPSSRGVTALSLCVWVWI